MAKRWGWLAFGAAMAALFVAERRRPLRVRKEPGPARIGRNLALAALFRAAQILLLGIDRETLRLWQQLLVVSVAFHHSNLELPIDMERRLVPFLVTPRMHGIHHSTRPHETDSNYSSLLSW